MKNLIILFLLLFSVTVQGNNHDTVKIFKYIKAPLNYDQVLTLIDKAVKYGQGENLVLILSDSVGVKLEFAEHIIYEKVDKLSAVSVIMKILNTETHYKYYIYSNRDGSAIAHPVFQVEVIGQLLAYTLTFEFRDYETLTDIILSK